MKKIILFILLLTFVSQVYAQTRELKGVVLDGTDKSSIIGATVLIKGTATGTATDIDGRFALSVKNSDVLIFSFIGMKSQEVAVGVQKSITVTLVSNSEEMDEVVVVAYGTRKKGTVSGAVSSVSSEKLQVPVVSFEQALQGQVAGMSVMTSSGEPGASSSVRIRGVNSISAGTEPLYILDGIAVTAGDFAALNSNDIGSITVLKDASSTSIYGARAANGVVVITTKRGRQGEKTRVSYSGKFGFSKLALGEWDMMNTTQKLDYEELVGLRVRGEYDRAALEAVNVDWRDALYNSHAPTTSHDLSVSGGGERSSYYASLGYYSQDGTAPASGIKRYSVRTNLETSANDWLKFGLNTTLGYTESVNGQRGGNSPHNPAFAVYQLNPYYAPYNADGSVSDKEFYEKYGVPNPLATALLADQSSNNLKVVGSAFVEIKPYKGVTLKSQAGVEGFYFRSSSLISPELAVQNGSGSANENFQRDYNLTITNLATYSNTFSNDHNMNILLGQEALSSNTSGFGATGMGLTDDRLLVVGLAPTQEADGGAISSSSYLSFFARGEYNYQYKYYLDASFRRDGSSRFGTNNKWANFWSVGAMWDVKKENFLSSFGALTSLQVSFNAGSSGNSSIPPYAHLPLFAGGPIYHEQPGFGPLELGNESLTWEKIFSYNLGLKFSFFNRIHVNIEAYKKDTKDMLMSVPVSMTSGFGAGWQNIGGMTNKGLEFDFNFDVMNHPEFKWNVAANFSYNKNEITELYNGKNEYTMANSGMKLTVGKDIGSFFFPRFAGVDPLNGDALWYTDKGEISREFSNNYSVLMDKSRYAPWNGGFTNTLSYKGVSLQAFFSWVSGRYMINNMRYFTESNGRLASMQQSVKMFDAWTPENRFTDVPRYGQSMQFDDRLLEDASFMRLKTLTLSWDLPQGWLSSWTRDVVSKVEVYGQAQNLFTWTNYSGLDPEVDSNVQLGSYPAPKTFLLGINVSF